MFDPLPESLSTLVEQLVSLGVRPGGVLLVHASYKALGPVPGGPAAVLAALREALGPEGTLLMPALSYMSVTAENPVFNMRETPSCVGILPETFRLSPGVERSAHPTHSVCASGPMANLLLGLHLLDHTPCGPHSPFHKLPLFGGKILMLGCGLRPNTSMHAIEELATPPYLFSPARPYTLELENGQTFQRDYIPHNFAGWEQRYDRVETYLPPSALKSGPALAGQAWLIDAPALWENALRQLRRDPFAFVQPRQ